MGFDSPGFTKLANLFDSDDPFSDDPFFGETKLYGGARHVNAWEVDAHTKFLREQGYREGDPLRITWRDSDGNVTQTELPLPRGDWKDPKTWSDFYDDMREFFEEIWGDDDGYTGEATAG